MSDYLERLRRDARILILQLLEDAPRYTSNGQMLRALLDEWGIVFTTDQVEGEIAWLAEQGLVVAERHGTLTVLTATARGLEVAQGIARHPGIERPKPRI
jgi:hypothetical protein